nr:hypothetical protein [Methanobrevibacter smithii]
MEVSKHFVHVKCRVSGTGHIRLSLDIKNILLEIGLIEILQLVLIQLRAMLEPLGVMTDML